ncbi:OmpA family protein [Vibrio sp. SCSIO 43137]|uniref:OmpA family protein n=1 Tax=Vibrio sp. SCSIO 43137 TaxID=3021011 RepID=UPI0023079566|nr:OmpA family protein [Vibrio sp. SCSIO 43137]WCE31962.1 OmpA family protein [Vibrio sp. SCSIO 43137]
MKSHYKGLFTLIISTALLSGCGSTPKPGNGGLAENYLNADFSPVMPDEPLGPEHGLRFDWQLSKLHLEMLVKEGADRCFPASVIQSRERQNRIARELEGGLMLDAANDLIILRKQLTELENRLNYVTASVSCRVTSMPSAAEHNKLEQVKEIYDLLNVDNQFAHNSSEINPKYMGHLASAANMLKQSPTLTLSVTGHADATGTPEHNDKLALERANQVKRYLTIFGLNPKRISTQSLGSQLPLFEGSSDAVRLTNRRVSIEVIDGKAQ